MAGRGAGGGRQAMRERTAGLPSQSSSSVPESPRDAGDDPSFCLLRRGRPRSRLGGRWLYVRWMRGVRLNGSAIAQVEPRRRVASLRTGQCRGPCPTDQTIESWASGGRTLPPCRSSSMPTLFEGRNVVAWWMERPIRPPGSTALCVPGVGGPAFTRVPSHGKRHGLRSRS